MPTPRILKKLAANQSKYTFISQAPISVDIVTTNLNQASFITSGAGNDSIRGGNANDTLSGGAGNDTLNGGAGNDLLDGGAGNDLLDGGEGADTLLGGGGEDTLNAGAGNDSLDGGTGHDILNGGAGADTMSGGTGDDTYFLDNAADVVIETLNGGIDNVVSSVSVNLSTLGGGFIENLTLTGSDTLSGIGNNLSNSITGNAGANLLDGGAGNDFLNGGLGADTLIGGLGDDTLVVDNAGDVVVESPTLVGGGVDTVISTASGYTLGGGVENLSLAGSALGGVGNSLNNLLTGNSLANSLDAGIGNDTINGGAGADTMLGGAGNDYYFVDNSADLVVEDSSSLGGLDTVDTTASYTLGGGVENLLLKGTAAIGVGNSLANNIVGTSLANTLDGGLGNDTLVGGEGNDYYILDNSLDNVVENTLSGGGIDTIEATFSYTLGGGVETLVLKGSAVRGLGNSIANRIEGNSLANTLDGGLGNDTLVGGEGNDYYILDNSLDNVVESSLSGGGIDTIEATFSYTLGGGLENLVLKGPSTLLSGIGNSLDNRISGNSVNNTLIGNEGNDTLDGREGADSMVGGAGNDFYFVDTTADVVVESSLSGGGIDTVISSVASYTLGVGVENLILTGAAFSGSGNELANNLTGNSANNTLNGAAGADTMDGKEGNDYYFVDNALDVILENPSSLGGLDTVDTTASYTLGGGIENLLLKGTAAIGVGNSIANRIEGNSLANTLDGGLGNDTLAGGDGSDYYILDNSLDNVVESTLSGGGIDTIEATFSYTLGGGVENLVLKGSAERGLGNSIANRIEGNSLANTLDGGLGNDTLVGGEGNDYYILDNSLDNVVESSLSGGGIDTIEATFSYTLGGGLENLVLKGPSTLLSGIGNSLDNRISGNSVNNTLIGNEGNDTLDGREGADSMVGGAGNDFYFVDTTADVVVESSLSGGGIDTVISSVASYTLGVGVENLILTGAAFSGTGNSLSNSLSGNNIGNSLNGGAGNDTLNGGLGNDTLIGGEGNDVYIVDSELDVIIEGGSSGTDKVLSSSSYALSNNIEVVELTGEDSNDAIGNSLDNTITGNTGDNFLDGGAGSDLLIGGSGDDALYGGDSEYDAEGNPGTADGVDSLFGGTGNDLLFASGDELNTTGDLLDGGAGDDTLIGGAGNDTLVVDSADSFIDGGAGQDVVVSSNHVNLTDGRFANIEEIRLTGDANINAIGDSADNLIYGNTGDNSLVGGEGIDAMAGGDGDDTYLIDNASDTVEELEGEGTDLVESSVTYTLADNVENLNLVGEESIDGTGNSSGNVITGNSLSNRLDGVLNDDASVGDTLIGGAGDDTFVVNSSEDMVEGGDDIDTVETSVDFVLGEDLENLILTGEAIAATGNSLDNEITGNEMDNTLDGGDGTDLLTGGAGDDVYFVDDSDLAVVEIEEEGTDLVISATDHILADNVENLVLTGDLALSGTGNILGNEITGNSLDNIIAGFEGDDTLIGDEGADSLLGGEGSDSLVGGAGNDTLVVDDSDLGIDGGDDSDLAVSTTDINLTDGRFTSVENIILTDIYVDQYIEDPDTGEQIPTGETVLSEIQPITAIGDSLANMIVGNLASNSLDGGLGADTIDGGAGNDTIFIDAEDVLIDGNDGTDTIVSNVTVSLTDSRFANVENISLIGSDSLSATGDDADNQIVGNDADNTLDGGAGADYLDGGDGADSLSGGDGIDTLIGGNGNDTLVLDIADYTGDTLNSALVDGGDGTDWLIADFNVSLWSEINSNSPIFAVENILLTGSDSLTATGDEAANLIIGNSGANTLTGGGGLDTLTGGGDEDLFVLGDASNNYYGGVGDDNTFALITDFNVEADSLQLKGSSSDYTVDATDPMQVLITATDASVGLVAKINIASGTASDVLNNAIFVS